MLQIASGITEAIFVYKNEKTQKRGSTSYRNIQGRLGTRPFCYHGFGGSLWAIRQNSKVDAYLGALYLVDAGLFQAVRLFCHTVTPINASNTGNSAGLGISSADIYPVSPLPSPSKSENSITPVAA